jgi:hypothetical protein
MSWFSSSSSSNGKGSSSVTSILVGCSNASPQLIAEVAAKYSASASVVHCYSQNEVNERKSKLWDQSARVAQNSLREREIDLELKALNGLDAGRIAVTYSNSEVVFDWI